MKGNDGTGNIPERDLWQTRKELFDKLNKQYGFTFDCCANSNNTKCTQWSGKFELWGENNLKNHICWMNPPFSKAREMFEHFSKVVNKGVCIYRCDNLETKLWQEIILKNASWIFVPKGRVSYKSFQYKRKEGTGSRFPSALIGFNIKPPKDMEGTTLYLNNTTEKNE
ncbi:hypothetical protein LCGC14_1714940 [marine sediment metagenome]|uniref:DNA N-6-adenine-methyltransferase (Dam) n=1 Tax=marine sediment metagenome TaxID=412755 RepID=A0A0F9HDV9_9ZZZZ